MGRNIITIKQSVFINKPVELVFDYTQDYDNRTKWDQNVIQASVLQNVPVRIVKLKMKGNTSMTFVYKLDERPFKTTLAAQDIQSGIIQTAGGHWIYEKLNNGTYWTQVNTLILKDQFMLALLKPFFTSLFHFQTKIAMQKARQLIELF